MKRVLIAAALAAVSAGGALAAPMTGAGVAPKGAPLASAGDRGEAAFAEKCGMCHRARGMGTFLLTRRMPAEQAQLEVRTDFDVETVTQVVRQGLGNMPAIPRGEVSDNQLADIANYLARSTAK